jgi:hypothetical protein
VVGERGWSAAASSLSGRGSLQEVDDPVAASRERSLTACSLLTPPPQAAVVQELIGGLGADVAIGAVGTPASDTPAGSPHLLDVRRVSFEPAGAWLR